MPEKKTDKRRSQPKTLDNTLGHVPPQAVDVERAVLGALMVDKDALSIVSDDLKAEVFYDSRHQAIFNAINQLNIDGRPIDLMTVTEQLKVEGTLENVGGASYVVELCQMVSSSAHIEYHTAILAKKSLARQLISYASRLETEAFDETIDAKDLLNDAESRLFELAQTNMKKDYTAIDPVLKEATKILQVAAKNDGGMTGVPTGYAEIDRITSGWQASDLVIIAGRPAMGKTSFALSVARNIAIDQRIPLAFFSLEMSNVQLVNRLMSNVCEVNGTQILTGQLDGDEWERIDRGVSQMQGAPLYLDDTSALNVFELRTKARRLVREHGVKVIMIDYLQLMTAGGARFSNRQEEVSVISRSLKQLAKELNIPILALSQLNRSVDTRDDKKEGKQPQLSDLRESGAIEQDADMVMFVHRPEYYKIYEHPKFGDLHGKAFIMIAKHRKGEVKDVMLDFKSQFTRFQDPVQDIPAFLENNSFSTEGLVESKSNQRHMEAIPPQSFEDAHF